MPSERAAIARAISDEIGNRRGERTDLERPQNIAEVDKGQETRDFAAKRAGFGNRETYRQAEAVVDKAEPEIVEAMEILGNKLRDCKEPLKSQWRRCRGRR